MQGHLPPQELAEFIGRSGERHAHARQVARRLKSLMPARLKQIEHEYRRHHGAAKALRLALNDQRYLAFLERAAEIQAAALESRVCWETHRMLFEARRSIQAFERAASLHRAKR